VTPESVRRLGLADELAARCPVELGREIAVSGSVSKGFADAESDIELNLWVDGKVDADAIGAWLRSLGIERVVEDPAGTEDVLWLGFKWRDTWVEAGWQRIQDASAIVDALAAGSKLAHTDLMFADVIVHALVLRTEGALARWKERLAVYPERLADALVEQVCQTWAYELWMEGRWTAARRGQWLLLTRVLQGMVTECLRALFALNRRWEPDWKWIPEITRDLELQPPDLAQRIEAILSLPDPFARL
jgi:hypothetical protein